MHNVIRRMTLALIAVSFFVGVSHAAEPEKSVKTLETTKLADHAPAYDEFARNPTLRSPVLSPDGKYLAVSVHNEKFGDKGAAWQLAVFKLPELKVVSRLNMAPRTLPAGVVWVSNTRLAMGVAHESGTLAQPQSNGTVIAVDYDGNHKRTLYTPSSRGRSSTRALLNALSMPLGFSAMAGVPEKRNGHIYLSVTPYKSRGTATSGSWKDRDSMLFDVDSLSGHATQIAKIDRAGMSFVLHDGVARFAYGGDDKLDQVVFVRAAADKPWHELPASVTGKRMTPIRISDDGKLLYSLYSATGGPDQLVVSKLDGSDRKVLASDDFASVAVVWWTPVSHKPYAVVFTDGQPRVSYIGETLDAKIHQALSKKFPGEFISFAGDSEDGKTILVVAHSDRDPGSVALFSSKTMNLKPLYRVLPWIMSQTMAKTMPIRFKNSEGTELDGYLTLPTDGAKKNVSLVFNPHGGPIGVRDGWFYNPDTQFLASRGYAVLQVNYRGSSGRGLNFQHSGWGQFGTGIIQDQLDAVHWAIDKGYANKHRICVYGGSFGGYSALMAPISEPGLFQCSVDYAGISDYTIEFNRSDTRQYAGGRYYFKNAIGTDLKTVKEISPIYHLDKFNIPVLIVHGEDDPRVPIQNATELRDALKAAGKPYEWLVKPKELHGFYSEANRADLYKTMEAFLAKYIGPHAQTAAQH